MNAPAATRRFARSMWVVMIVGLVVAMALLAFALAPVLRANLHTRNLISETAGELEARQLLLPVHVDLELRKRTPMHAELALPETPTRIPRPAIDKIHVEFEALAVKHGLSPVEVLPRAETVEDRGSFLVVESRARGTYSRMRGFVLDVLKMDSFVHLEEVRINKVNPGEEIMLHAWLAVE